MSQAALKQKDVGNGQDRNVKQRKKLLHNFSDLGGNGHQQEHHDLFEEIRAGRLPNEGEWGAKSTMTAILGRLATYSGKVVKWDDALKSDKVLAPVEAYTSFDAEAPVKPDADGWYALPVPGQYKAV